MTCRRCSECPGAEHHWMDNYDAREETDPQFACKHCDVVGDECEACEGEGGDAVAVDVTEGTATQVALCPPCKGHGVITRPTGSPGCACPRDDARDCIRWRSKDDMREHLGAPALCDEDDECECSCHDSYEDDDSDDEPREPATPPPGQREQRRAVSDLDSTDIPDEHVQPHDSCEECGVNIYEHQEDGDHLCDQCAFFRNEAKRQRDWGDPVTLLSDLEYAAIAFDNLGERKVATRLRAHATRLREYLDDAMTRFEGSREASDAGRLLLLETINNGPP